MLTGSAPTLRPLWKKPTDTNNYYDPTDLSYGASRLSHGRTNIHATQRSFSEATTTTKDFKRAEDGVSEEYILEPQPAMPIEVVRTTDVSVDFDKTRDGEEREMHDAQILPKGW
jgi:hypothetical protein